MHEASHIAELVGSIIALLLIAAVILAATKRLKLPFIVALVVVGVGLSWLARNNPHTLAPIHNLELSPDLILYVFLPTLIFESAFNLDARRLRHSLGQVLTLAVEYRVVVVEMIGSELSVFSAFELVDPDRADAQAVSGLVRCPHENISAAAYPDSGQVWMERCDSVRSATAVTP